MDTENRIYLDYAATTPVTSEVVGAMVACLGMDGDFGNPASQEHIWGHNAREAVEHARLEVAVLLNADPSEIIWTSGATEANNLAIKGSVEAVKKPGKHLVTSAIEHAAVLDCFAYLEMRGYDVTYLQPDSEGLIALGAVEEALRSDTLLVSLMYVNNELGTITNIEEIGKLTRSRGILFHVDAAQGVGRLGIDVNEFNIDLLSLSGHKIYAPKGVGALFVRGGGFSIGVEPQIHGGGHERGLRSGTLPTHQIVGLGVAARVVTETLSVERARMETLTEQALASIACWCDVSVNGKASSRVPGLLNITIEGVSSKALMAHLPHIAISSGSACSSADIKSSHVLLALGLGDERADSSVRLSFGRFTTEEDLERAMKDISVAIEELRSLRLGDV